MRSHRGARGALSAAAALALALGLSRPAWALRALCALTGPHAYMWREGDGEHPAHLSCLICRAVPRLFTSVEPARAGCHGCVDCVCRSAAWPAIVTRATGGP